MVVGRVRRYSDNNMDVCVLLGCLWARHHHGRRNLDSKLFGSDIMT